MKQLLTLALAVLLAGGASAQQGDHQAMMKAWQAYMTPGAVHKMLAKSNGKWTTETTMWMAPGAPAQKSAGSCVNSMVLGGRYQESVFKGKMMDMPFEGRGMTAYDNAKNMFIMTWADNMGTGLMTMTGKWDDATKSITFTGNATDPMTGKDTPMREVFTIKDDNHHMMEMYGLDEAGKEYKMMEVAFTRAKA